MEFDLELLEIDEVLAVEGFQGGVAQVQDFQTQKALCDDY